jgi:N-acyl-D-aspartate/D-glutamate deacylase
MFELIIRNGLVVDGSGLAGRHADVAVGGDRIAAVGRLAGERAARTIDAEGMVVAPGIVDVHTHYDPQVTWDPLCDTSGLHGVTTVVAGNCGFSVAPCRRDDHDYLAQVFARVEGMDLSALGHVDWRFETFPEFMAAMEGRLGLNLGMYVGHSALRRYVMGDACYERPSNDAERDRIIALTAEALEAGAMGWSSSKAPVHLDLADRPVPSRLAGLDEVRGMADAVGRTGGVGSIAYAPESSMDGVDAADRDLMIDLARRGGVPVITQGLGGRSKTDAPELAWQEASDFLDRSASLGAPVYCLLMVRGFRGPFTLERGTTRYEGVPLWDELFHLPLDERRRRMADPDRRPAYRQAVDNPNRDPSKGSTLPPLNWETLRVEEARSEATQGYAGRSIADIARQQRRHPADTLFDIALADDLRTVFHWSSETPAWYDVLRRAQRHPQMIVGISDGGAHLDRDDGAAWSTYFLRQWWQDEHLWRLEEAVRLMTIVPAGVCGVAGRGLLRPGWFADIAIFDPDALDVDGRLDHDRATGASRFRNVPKGFRATIVNGVPVVEHGEATGERPGHLVRPT